MTKRDAVATIRQALVSSGIEGIRGRLNGFRAELRSAWQNLRFQAGDSPARRAWEVASQLQGEVARRALDILYPVCRLGRLMARGGPGVCVKDEAEGPLLAAHGEVR